MAVSSPRLVSRAIGQAVDLEELGGWKLHAETTGQIDMVVDTDEEALDAIRTFLSYLPSHNMEAPPVHDVTPNSGKDMVDIHKVLPEKRTQVYNMKKHIFEAFFKFRNKKHVFEAFSSLQHEKKHVFEFYSMETTF